MSIYNRKVVIVGAGHVGSHVGYALISQSLADEIVYIDSDRAKAVAQALDLTDATNYLPVRTKVTAGDYSDAADAQIMIIAAGPLPSGSQTRMDTLGQTIEILLILLLRLLFDPDISGQLAGAAVVFCLSLIALYSASSVYHFSLRGEAVLRRLKKLDHSMIYVLIAGSYTPIILKFMPAPRSFLFLGVIWLIALTGIAVKLLWIDAPRLIGTALYLALGWAIAFDFGVVLSMPSPAIALLAAGGLAYTAGGIIYISKRPNFSTLLGFHELFHLFVIVGSICHYLMVMLYVL